MTAARKAASNVDSNFAPVVAAFAGDRRVSQQKMFSSENVLSVDGKIFAMLRKGMLVVKLPKLRVDELVSGAKGARFKNGSRVMKEWLVLPGRAGWVALAKEAYGFVGGGSGRLRVRRRA